MKNFINEKEINLAIENGNISNLNQIINKLKEKETISITEVADLLMIDNYDDLDKLKEVSNTLKEEIYGNRIVIFAPLYISDYCVNDCKYCGYKITNQYSRFKLSHEEIKNEVKAIEKIGHKRLALEVGEDQVNCDFDYILDAIDTIYDSGDIRRINVNIAATSIENYQRLKEKKIGTSILFQETYDENAYKKEHRKGPKSNYERQLFAHHRAMEAGIGDVGGGVLFGLADYKFDLISLYLHHLDLIDNYDVGFHTVSVPRIQESLGTNLKEYENLVSDFEFEKIVLILRVIMPYVGLILSTRENISMRKKLIAAGITQISAGSKTDVGGYKKTKSQVEQFSLHDDRSLLETVIDLVDDGYIPSFCTACYRTNRVGANFLELAKSGDIREKCVLNSVLTLVEYVYEFGDEELQNKVDILITKQINTVDNDKLQAGLYKQINKIKEGNKDLFV